MGRLITALRLLFGLDVLGKNAPDDLSPDEELPPHESAWLDEAAFMDEHAAECSAEIPASPNN